MADTKADLVFNLVTFGVPGQTFEIDAHVTAEERLPVVTEFAIRLIYICGSMKPQTLRDYFGLTDSEGDSLLDSLADQYLVEWEDDRIVPTLYTKERFAASSDEFPRFSKVEPLKGVVKFELLTFSPIDKLGDDEFVKNLVEIPILDKENVSNSNAKAEAAYERYFHDIMRDRGQSRRDRELYKISSVQGKKSFFMPVPMRFALDDSSQVVRVDPFEEKLSSEFMLAVNGAVSDLMAAPLSAPIVQLKEFVDLFEDRVIGQFIDGRTFDLDGYIRAVFKERTVSYSGDAEPLFGNIYLEGNTSILSRWIAANSRFAVSEKNYRFSSSVAWLAPDYEFWGRTSLLRRLIKEVELELAKGGKHEYLHLLVPGEFGARRATLEKFRGTGLSRAHLVKESPLMGRLELLLFPACVACAIFHYAAPNNPGLWLPFGFITNNMKRIETIRKLMEKSSAGANYLGRLTWRSDELLSGEENTSNGQLGFLNYLPVS